MIDNELTREIPSVQTLLDWFGYLPNFHDAEIVKIVLNRQGRSELVVHAFRTTGAINTKGQFLTEKHAIVTFGLDDVSDTELCGFNNQNVISGLVIQKVDTSFRLNLYGCYGVQGYIVSARIEIDIEAGMPAESVYAETLRPISPS